MTFRQLGFLFVLFILTSFPSCNFDANAPDLRHTKLNLTITAEPFPSESHTALPSSPTITDFWRGALIVSGDGIDTFQFNMAVENQRVIKQDIEFEIPFGSKRRIAVVLVSDGSSDLTLSPFDLQNKSSAVYIYLGETTFEAKNPEENISIHLTPKTYTQSFDLKQLVQDPDLVEVYVHTPADLDKKLEESIGALSSPDFYSATLPGAITNASSSSLYIGMRLPYNLTYAVFAIPAKSAAYTHGILEQTLLNISKGTASAPITRMLLANFSPKTMAGTTIHPDQKSPQTIQSHQYAVSKSGRQYFLNPDAPDSSWKEKNDFDSDGHGLAAELEANSDPFDPNSVPGAILRAVDSIQWGVVTTVDSGSAQYKQLRLKFSENGDELGMIGFIRGSGQIMHGSDPNISLYTIPVVSVPQATGTEPPTTAPTFGTKTVSLPDKASSSAMVGDLRSFDMCLASSKFGLLVANSTHDSFIPPSADFLEVRALLLASSEFKGQPQFLSEQNLTNPINNFAYDVGAKCSPLNNTGSALFTYAQRSQTVGTQNILPLQLQSNTGPWGVAVAHVISGNTFQIIKPTDNAKLSLYSVVNIDTPETTLTFPSKPFDGYFVNSTTLFMGIPPSLSPPKVTGLKIEGTTITSFPDSQTRGALMIEQMHVVPVGQVIQSQFIHGTVHVFAQTVQESAGHQRQIMVQFFDGSKMQAPVPLATVPASDSSLTILAVESFSDKINQQPGPQVLVLYRKKLSTTFNELRLATLELDTTKGLYIKTDASISSQSGSIDHSYTAGKIAFINKVQAVIVYVRVKETNKYGYYSLAYDDGLKHETAISNDVSSITTQASDLLVDVDVVKGNEGKILSIFTICSKDATCNLHSASGSIKAPATAPPPRPRTTVTDWFRKF